MSAIVVLFFNLCALYYSVARWLFLRDTGRKLMHLDRQLATRDTALEDLGLTSIIGAPDVPRARPPLARP